MADDMGEKSEAPTPRRLSEARQKGQIAKSMDLSAAVDLIGATIVIAFFGFSMLGLMGGALRRVLDFDDAIMSPQESTQLLAELVFRGLLIMTPILLIMAGVALVAQLMQVGLLMNPDAISLKFEKLNPVQGAKNQLSRKNLVKSLLNTLKLSIVLVVGWLVVSRSGISLRSSRRGFWRCCWCSVLRTTSSSAGSTRRNSR
jgi:flagellar biosynthetic protein FlhB